MPIDCHPGDIILVPDEGYFSLVSVGQGVARLNPVIAASTASGSIYANHAAIGVGTAKKYNSEELNISQVAHATGSKGIHRSSIGAYGANMKVYRMRNNPGMAMAAHNVALRWSEGVNTGQYSKVKAMAPAFHSSSYGSGAKERARFYHSHRNTLGGPPGIKNDKKAMFCSMFVIAAYQAALGELVSAAFMALDAPNTSPMKLQDYLKTAGTWIEVA